MPVPHFLVLFDIDGTLLITGGASSRCMLRSAKHVFGDSFEWMPISPGRLDHQLFGDLLDHNGIDRSPASIERWRKAYIAEMTAELTARQTDIRVMPGIVDMLDALDTCEDIAIGLLTGNFQPVADAKMERSGLGIDRFTIRVYAEDGDSRDALPAIAMARCEQHFGGPIDPQAVIVVGDTPRDIACARAHGCRVLAVATGRYSSEELRGYAPDASVESLADPNPFWALLGRFPGTSRQRNA